VISALLTGDAGGCLAFDLGRLGEEGEGLGERTVEQAVRQFVPADDDETNPFARVTKCPYDGRTIAAGQKTGQGRWRGLCPCRDPCWLVQAGGGITAGRPG